MKLYHAENSRSDTIVQLVKLLGLTDKVEIINVSIVRQDGSGARDPKNAHPEGKVPYLIDGDSHIRERGAMIAYLTDMVPESRLGRPVGDAQRGDYLSWLFYYQGVMEPVAVLQFTGISHPAIDATFRDYDTMLKRLDEVLTQQPYLLGQDFSAADLLCFGPFAQFPEVLPVTPAMKEWLARCQRQVDSLAKQAA